MNEDRWREIRGLATEIMSATPAVMPTPEIRNDLARASLALAALLLTDPPPASEALGQTGDMTLQLRPGKILPATCGTCPFLGRRES